MEDIVLAQGERMVASGDGRSRGILDPFRKRALNSLGEERGFLYNSLFRHGLGASGDRAGLVEDPVRGSAPPGGNKIGERWSGGHP